MAVFRASQPIEPKIVEIGKIYKGSKKKNIVSKSGKEVESYGDELEYYRFEPLERFKKDPSFSGKYSSLYAELLARYEELDKQQIKIVFPYPNIQQVWYASNQKWQTVGKDNRCIRYCDGVTTTLHWDDEKAGGSPYAHIPCAAEPGMQKCPKECVPTGKLRSIISGLNYPGEVILTTHSIKDITTISANLEAYREYDLREIPFLLVKTQQNCRHTNAQGRTFNKKKWFCHVEVEPSFGAAMLHNRLESLSTFVAPQPIQKQSVDSDLGILRPEPPNVVKLPSPIKTEAPSKSRKERMLERIIVLTNKLQNLRSTAVPVPSEELTEQELSAWGLDLRGQLEKELRRHIRLTWQRQHEEKIEIPEAELDLELESLKLEDLEKIHEVATSRLTQTQEVAKK